MLERKSCWGCVYQKQLNDAQLKYCDYLSMTGVPRGCPADKCLRKTKTQAKKKGSAK